MQVPMPNDKESRRKSIGATGNNQLPDDDPVRFLQKYFGNKEGGSNKKSGVAGAKLHPNYIMNKLDKQFKKD